QQGRIVGGDRVRPEGGGNWDLVSASPLFATYLPRPAAQPAAEDRAEALEPIGFDIPSSRPQLGEDEDVDMIPLIDISLVLLIFFMMTASVSSGILSPIVTPPARDKLDVIIQNSHWAGIQARSGARTIDKGPEGLPRRRLS